MASSMSYNGGDSLPLSFSEGYKMLALSLVVLYVVVMYGLFGSLWPPQVIDMYHKKSRLQKRYSELFDSRNNLLFHIAWFKEQGEYEEARRMQKQLVQLDFDIDALEENFAVLTGKPSMKKPKDVDKAL